LIGLKDSAALTEKQMKCGAQSRLLTEVYAGKANHLTKL
jgi:hypothetical protein